MAAYWTLCDPADFGEWGGDDSGLVGQVWQEWTEGYESRRCEKWAKCWLFSDGPFGGYGGASKLSLDEVAQLQANGFPIRQVREDEFEAAWALAVELGSEMNPYGDAKIRDVQASME